MEETGAEGTNGEIAYRRLLGEIGSGLLVPGARLRETEIAERYHLSRTPIREALRLLEADGLIEHLPRQGACVRSLDYAEIAELYEMRAVLESTAARLAARAATEVEIEEIRAIQEELARSDPGPAARDLNRQFHFTVMQASKNRFLLRSMTGLQRTLLLLGPTTLGEPMRAEEALQEHEAVLSALVARDGERAALAMRQHIEAAHRSRLRVLRRARLDGPGLD